jgi:hypothetical protein
VTTSEYKVRQRVRAPRDRLSSAPRLPRGVARSRRARCRGVAARDREIAATVAIRSIARERKKNAKTNAHRLLSPLVNHTRHRSRSSAPRAGSARASPSS